ncbi:hypothetical protein ANN_03297 [Periplaneta americana]|uniref:Uncharacterized protein n=1 Tax=Periplaneta americana TaxID=6978 RepID=A0ABQ8TZU6_PERAM|nr:hypothetical protein ANN_03297 [Periplaneta americana]
MACPSQTSGFNVPNYVRKGEERRGRDGERRNEKGKERKKKGKGERKEKEKEKKRGKKRNGRTLLKDDKRPGRPHTCNTAENVEKNRQIVHNGPHVHFEHERPQLWTENKWMLHDDKAAAHRALATRDKMFMKFKLKDRRLGTVEEIQSESQKVLDKLQERDFQEAFQKWQTCWDQCIAAQGDYFEGDRSQI